MAEMARRGRVGGPYGRQFRKGAIEEPILDHRRDRAARMDLV